MGSFRVFGSRGDPKPVVIGFVSRFWGTACRARTEIGFVSHICGVEIGFVSHIWAVGTEIGFVLCIWVVGGSPGERPGLNTGVTPLARVLSDGG